MLCRKPSQFLYSIKNDAKALSLNFKEQKKHQHLDIIERELKKNDDCQTTRIKLQKIMMK
jgi:hypothetical protein